MVLGRCDYPFAIGREGDDQKRHTQKKMDLKKIWHDYFLKKDEKIHTVTIFELYCVLCVGEVYPYSREVGKSLKANIFHLALRGKRGFIEWGKKGEDELTFFIRSQRSVMS